MATATARVQLALADAGLAGWLAGSGAKGIADRLEGDEALVRGKLASMARPKHVKRHGCQDAPRLH